MKLIRLNSFLYLFCILSVFASCVQKPDSSVEDWNRTFINTKKLISEACLDRELILGRPFLIQYVDSSLLIYDDIGDSLFLLVDLKEKARSYPDELSGGQQQRVTMNSCKFLLSVI